MSASPEEGPGTAGTDAALLKLLRRLKERRYAFVTPTPMTHGRVIARRQEAASLRDVLGWSLPFRGGVIDPELERLLAEGGALEPLGEGRFRSAVRVSEVRGELYLHSTYPTEAADAVFLGPDSYRFAELIALELRGDTHRPSEILDIGAGAGVGGLTAARFAPVARLTFTDLNPKALAFARINARAQGREIQTVVGEFPEPGGYDLAVANPPYLLDAKNRLYRHGGGEFGSGASLSMTRGALSRLRPGGRLILYSGSAIVAGEDRLRSRLAELAEAANAEFRYREIDPDVFGEELEEEAYAGVERIAAIGAVMTRRT